METSGVTTSGGRLVAMNPGQQAFLLLRTVCTATSLSAERVSGVP